jgi:hypothetical protein
MPRQHHGIKIGGLAAYQFLVFLMLLALPVMIL